MTPNRTYRALFWTLSVVVAVSAGSCTKAPESASELVPERIQTAAPEPESTQTTPATSDPKIVVTILPMYFFTRGVAGTEAQIELLVPPSISFHDYQASPNSTAALAQAQVLIKNGLGAEEFLDQLIANAGNPQLQQIDASKGIAPLQGDHDHGHTEDEPTEGEQTEGEHSAGEGHSHEAGNPHIWLDPVLAQQQVINIREGLIAADPANAERYRKNAEDYLQKLQQLDQDFKTRLASNPGCRFIALHDAYPYLAKRYDLQQMAVVELPEDSFTPQDLQRVVNAVNEYQVKALVSEIGVDDSRLNQISNDVGLPIKTLDPLETGPLDPQYYFTAMQSNLQNLEDVCKSGS
ncbi:MAG: metal ABC transporter solute-binding protein, Zn/Mn family [Microcoleaceae cyanobacterium]